MRNINRGKQRLEQRRLNEATRKLARSLRSDEEQLALIATRPGSSQKEFSRLTKRMQKEAVNV